MQQRLLPSSSNVTLIMASVRLQTNPIVFTRQRQCYIKTFLFRGNLILSSVRMGVEFDGRKLNVSCPSVIEYRTKESVFFLSISKKNNADINKTFTTPNTFKNCWESLCETYSDMCTKTVSWLTSSIIKPCPLFLQKSFTLPVYVSPFSALSDLEIENITNMNFYYTSRKNQKLKWDRL